MGTREDSTSSTALHTVDLGSNPGTIYSSPSPARTDPRTESQKEALNTASCGYQKTKGSGQIWLHAVNQTWRHNTDFHKHSFESKSAVGRKVTGRRGPRWGKASELVLDSAAMGLALASSEQSPMLALVTVASWEPRDQDTEEGEPELIEVREGPLCHLPRFQQWDLTLSLVLLQLFSRTHLSSKLRAFGPSCAVWLSPGGSWAQPPARSSSDSSHSVLLQESQHPCSVLWRHTRLAWPRVPGCLASLTRTLLTCSFWAVQPWWGLTLRCVLGSNLGLCVCQAYRLPHLTLRLFPPLGTCIGLTGFVGFTTFYNTHIAYTS